MSGRRLVAALAVSLSVQTLTAMGLAVPAVLAPVAAADFGAAPTELGRWVGFAYRTAMFAGSRRPIAITAMTPTTVNDATTQPCWE